MNAILKLCFEELGVKGISGEDDNARILNYATESGLAGVPDDETPWSVSVAGYDSSKVLQFRCLDEATSDLGLPKPTLKLTSRGAEVEKLQNILNTLGYTAGDADGIFGQRTLNALKVFQADNGLLVDGVYGKKSKDVLEGEMGVGRMRGIGDDDWNW